jgi:hypothetical protein
VRRNRTCLDFYRITTGGLLTLLGDIDHGAKGLAPAAPRELPTPSIPLLGLLGAALLGIGVARIHDRDLTSRPLGRATDGVGW